MIWLSGFRINHKLIAFGQLLTNITLEVPATSTDLFFILLQFFNEFVLFCFGCRVLIVLGFPEALFLKYVGRFKLEGI